MKIKVEFTLEIPKEQLPKLRKFTEAKDNVEAADFVREEAKDYVVNYLRDNDIDAKVLD